MKNKINEIYSLEKLAGGNTVVHRLHPMAKLLSAAVFVITVVSFGRYDFSGLIPYMFYPMLLIALSEIPFSVLLKKFLPALPFCLFAGTANLIFDSAPAFTAGHIPVSRGAVSFAVILIKTYLCVTSVLILVSSTPFSDIANEMRRLKIPDIFIVMFEMTYRYIGVLLSEAYSMYTAYSLRSFGGAGKNGIKISDMGSFTGQLLLRSFDRAERVYSAMKCRGYSLASLRKGNKAVMKKDYIYFAVVCVFCAVFRFIGIDAVSAVFGRILQ